jgi:hypothetical protein
LGKAGGFGRLLFLCQDGRIEAGEIHAAAPEKPIR